VNLSDQLESHARLGALRLSISSTVLIYGIIPFGIIAIVALLVLSRGGRTKVDRRYRPGRAYEFQPIWFVSSPERLSIAADTHRPATEMQALESSSGALVVAGPTGGASDSW
jgi:hypothetical protein